MPDGACTHWIDEPERRLIETTNEPWAVGSQTSQATGAPAVIITMITVGGTLILAIGGAAWRIGMRLGMVEQGLTGCEDKIRELRTDVRELGTEMQTNVRELRTEVHTDIRELRTEIREVNRKVDRIIERLPPPVS